MAAYENMTIVETSKGVELTDEQVAAASILYEEHRDNEDGPVLVGLYGEDLRSATKDIGTIMVKYTIEADNEPVYAPLLVPTDRMEWYNLPYLHEKYGENTSFYCFVHPPVPGNKRSLEVVSDAVKDVLDEGSVVLFEQYRGYPPIDSSHWVPEEGQQVQSEATILNNGGEAYTLEGMSTGKLDKRSDIFVGQVSFENVSGVRHAPSIIETYQTAVQSNEIEIDPHNGPVLESVMTEEDAQRVWDIYEKPFERLSKGNPVLAGFDEESLKALLLNPNVVKAVNRVNGEITTVSIFTQSLEHCPWFNSEYFRREYPEYYESGNILMCPSIVTDEERRGAAYSWSLVKLLAEVCAKRGTNILLAFECTEISTRYIPEKVVKRGVRATGLAQTSGFDNPTAVIEYKALRKVSAPNDTSIS